jgi:hypothetical protein
MIFAALIQNWKAIALIAMVATALIDRAVLVNERDTARAQAAAESGAATVLRLEKVSLTAAVARENAAAGALQDKIKLAQRRATQRKARYAAIETKEMNRELAHANAIRIAASPPGCQGALDWGNAQGPELGRW